MITSYFLSWVIVKQISSGWIGQMKKCSVTISSGTRYRYYGTTGKYQYDFYFRISSLMRKQGMQDARWFRVPCYVNTQKKRVGNEIANKFWSNTREPDISGSCSFGGGKLVPVFKSFGSWAVHSSIFIGRVLGSSVSCLTTDKRQVKRTKLGTVGGLPYIEVTDSHVS